MSSSTEKRRNSRQFDDTPTLATSPTTSATTSDKPAPPPINPLPLTSTPASSNLTSASPLSEVQKPALYHTPTDIITATEKGMISGSLCATMPSSSSTTSSQKHDSEARDVAADTEEETPPVLTRAEEACVREGRKGSWAGGEREGGRCVMFKGVDV
ncbi:hypothetical protein AA0116_g8650 [Alternaria tenuissima]|nr:hypothetical protein AA0116_g8650 [Alternaria tenuissima]